MTETPPSRLATSSAPPADEVAALLRAESLTKFYPGVDALVDVDFELRPGEVHVLFGENGAGKSTLISILAGAQPPSRGRILFRGQAVTFASVHEARQVGISAVFQDFSLVPQLTVGANLFLGAEVTRRGFLHKRDMRRRAEEILARLGFPLKANERVMYLSRAEQQMVEIAKAFRDELSVLILDEPTASLTERETEHLFTLIEQAKADNVGIIYITHRVNEIKRIGDRITVLRDGRKVATLDVAEVSDQRLIELMTGRVISQVFPEIDHRPGELLLEVAGLTTADGTVRDVSLRVRAGEIVGIAGLVGSGKSEVARACFGLEPVVAGTVTFNGREVTGRSPRDMLDCGLFYVPPDRRTEGLLLGRSVVENVTLPSLSLPAFSGPVLMKRAAQREAARNLAGRLNLQPPSIDRIVGRFSGGNQQKVMIAKALTREVKLFVFDEPTVGVDVGTRVAIYDFLRELCEAGAGILLVSSDLPEILYLPNRTYVMFRGEMRAELIGDEITEDRVLARFFEKQAA